MSEEPPRWSADQVLSLAPDAPAQRAGRSLATATPWQDTGYSAAPTSLWGWCKGSGAKPYQTCVDLTEPAYRCSCPSRKFPCKHALGLLLLWSAGAVDPAAPPDWVTEWLTSRTERKDKAQERAEVRASRPADPATAAASQARRAKRVGAGVAELERWLTDQVRQGLAGVSRAGYDHWDSMAARLVDAQAPGLASAVRRLAMFVGSPDRLLAELGLIWLLVRAYPRLGQLPPELAATVRSRIGLPVGTEEVLAQAPVRDEWSVIGLRDEVDERLTVRRVWLRGAGGGSALILSFAAAGTPLPADLVPGTAVDADLCFYPGAQPLRALVSQRHGEPRPLEGAPAGLSIAAALAEYAGAVAAEPWLDRWPMVLADATPVRRDGWHLADATGALPLDLADPWRLVAAAGGAPATVAGVWSAAGLRPLTLWAGGRMVRP